MLSSIPLTGLGWIELTYSNGAPYGSHCKGEGRVSRIFFFCDSAAGDVSGPSNTPHVGVLCQWPAHHVCMLHSDQGVRYDSCHLDCLHKLKSECFKLQLTYIATVCYRCYML